MAGFLRGRDEGRKETAVLHKRAVAFDWPRLRKPIPVTLWMGKRGALTDVKNTHPSEFWIRKGFGWGRMGILPAVTIAAADPPTRRPSARGAGHTDYTAFFCTYSPYTHNRDCENTCVSVRASLSVRTSRFLPGCKQGPAPVGRHPAALSRSISGYMRSSYMAGCHITGGFSLPEGARTRHSTVYIQPNGLTASHWSDPGQILRKG